MDETDETIPRMKLSTAIRRGKRLGVKPRHMLFLSQPTHGPQVYGCVLGRALVGVLGSIPAAQAMLDEPGGRDRALVVIADGVRGEDYESLRDAEDYYEGMGTSRRSHTQKQTLVWLEEQGR